MSASPPLVFALQIEDSDRFIDIFGSAFSAVVWDDIVVEFAQITGKILRSYEVLEDVISPCWGRCFQLFAPKQPSISTDMEEQVAALTAAGRQLIREMMQKNMGAATGSRLDFNIMITSVSEASNDIQGINSKLDLLFKTLPPVGYPALSLTHDQFVKIIEKKEVEIYLQPIVAIPGEKIVGYEALSRGTLAGASNQADMLFGTAAQLGLTEELELLCIEKALDLIQALPDQLWMSINIGPALLKSDAFGALIFQEYLKPYWPRIVFELTEHLPIDSVLELQETVQTLKNHGMCLSLDDTGCGFFDLHTVEQFRPSIVKLCITIIRRIGRSEKTLIEFNETVSRLAEYGDHILGEGVEEMAQLEVLKQCGVSMAQGYYFDKPRPARDVLKDMV